MRGGFSGVKGSPDKETNKSDFLFWRNKYSHSENVGQDSLIFRSCLLTVPYFFTVQVHDQVRRVVLWRLPVGDPVPGLSETARQDGRQAGPGPAGHHVLVVPGGPGGPGEALQLPQGRVRPDDGVLEEGAPGQAVLQGDTPVPAEEKPGIRARVNYRETLG